MTKRLAIALVLMLPCFGLLADDGQKGLKPEFHTSDRCLACHNGLTTPTGQDISIGLAWRSSVMANSSRDPYWQGSVRRETIDHPGAALEIEDECSICHMPMAHYIAKTNHKKLDVFSYLPFKTQGKDAAIAQDGVSCSLCHQIGEKKLGTRESFSGGFVIDPPATRDNRPEYGPFQIAPGQEHIMQTSTGGFRPTEADHIRDSALCGSCHQLYTTARDRDGKEIGYLAEQMPYLEWRHSDYPAKSSCQSCHMPEVPGEVAISSVLGVPRSGVRQHVFVGGNFLLQRMLNQYRDELDVSALPQELTAAAEGTEAFLKTQSARLTLRNIDSTGGVLNADLFVENLTGHKLPTAYPSRRAWIHFVVRDRDGHIIFESGALNQDGSIQGNDNDADRERYEPHYREITSPEQVQIYEPILKDSEGRVTTGLISAVGYLKDNRLLPSGFDKQSAEKDIAVVGDAAEDPNFGAGGDLIRYSIPLGTASGPFHIEVELWYQPIGFRWAHNLSLYKAEEPQRFVRYYDSMSQGTAVVLGKTESTR